MKFIGIGSFSLHEDAEGGKDNETGLPE